ncbi:hypothetical protein GPALN_014364 [Globodera pallida]|nr:hypothetical protein GPALN_014364 [Globodera pallida]
MIYNWNALMDILHNRLSLVSETTTRYGPNRLLALVPSVELHKSAAKFFYTLAFWGHDGVGQHVTVQDFQEVTQPEQHLRYYISLNAGDEREAMRAFFRSQQVLETLSTRYHCQFRFITLEDERCAIHLYETTTRYGPNRLLALVPSVEMHRQHGKFFYTLAFWGHDGVGQHVTVQDFQEVTQPEQHLRFYVSLNGGDGQQALRAFFGSPNTIDGIATTCNCRFLFIQLEDERCLWDLALVTFESLDVLLGNWNALMDVMHSRLSMIRSAQPVEPIVGGPTTDSPPNLT